MRATTILQRCFGDDLNSIHKTRLKPVFFGVDALLRGGRLSLTELGRWAAGHVSPKHNIKRIDRLLGNRHLPGEIAVFGGGMASFLLGSNRRPYILVDWTRIGDKRCALVASLARDGRAVVLYFEVHSKHRLSNPTVERVFLQRLRAVIPADCRPIIVTDGGYRTPWFRQINAMGWDYVGRLSSLVYVQQPGQGEWLRGNVIEGLAGRRVRDLGMCSVAKTQEITQRVVLSPKFRRNPKRSAQRRRPGDRDRGYQATVDRNQVPWVLVTSCTELSAKAVHRIYGLRMQIEETFRDTKNHRFGWSFRHARAHSNERYAVLLLLAALAGLVLSLVGIAAEHAKLQFPYQANTIRGRRVLSLFHLGKTILARARPYELLRLDMNQALAVIKTHEIIK